MNEKYRLRYLERYAVRDDEGDCNRYVQFCLRGGQRTVDYNPSDTSLRTCHLPLHRGGFGGTLFQRLTPVPPAAKFKCAFGAPFLFTLPFSLFSGPETGFYSRFSSLMTIAVLSSLGASGQSVRRPLANARGSP